MKLVKWIDQISVGSGAVAAFLIIPLLIVVVFEVIARHGFNAPTAWGYDTCWMLFSAQFLLGGAFTLLRKGHIRIDIVYNVLSPRTRRIYDLVIYIVVFMIPLVLLTYAGVKYAADAWMTGEKLSTTNWFFPSGPSKSLIPVGFFLLGLQTLAEMIRSIHAIKKGAEQ